MSLSSVLVTYNVPITSGDEVMVVLLLVVACSEPASVTRRFSPSV